MPAIDLEPLHGPHGLTFVGGKTWFTAEGSKAIGRFDPATQKVDWVLGTGQDRTHMIWVSEDEKKIVTANVASGTMTLMELMARQQGPGGPPPGPRPAGAPMDPHRDLGARLGGNGGESGQRTGRLRCVGRWKRRYGSRMLRMEPCRLLIRQPESNRYVGGKRQGSESSEVHTRWKNSAD